jgi:hypothetical protein
VGSSRARPMIPTGVFPNFLLLQVLQLPLACGATKGLRRARRLRMILVISRRTRFTDLSVVVCLFVHVCGVSEVCVSRVGVCTCMNRYYSCTLMRVFKKKMLENLVNPNMGFILDSACN